MAKMLELTPKLAADLKRILLAEIKQRHLSSSNKSGHGTVHNWTADALYKRGLISYWGAAYLSTTEKGREMLDVFETALPGTKVMVEVPDGTPPNVDPLLTWAWTLIANASGGFWEKESTEWQHGAALWRDKFHDRLADSDQ